MSVSIIDEYPVAFLAEYPIDHDVLYDSAAVIKNDENLFDLISWRRKIELQQREVELVHRPTSKGQGTVEQRPFDLCYKFAS